MRLSLRVSIEHVDPQPGMRCVQCGNENSTSFHYCSVDSGIDSDRAGPLCTECMEGGNFNVLLDEHPVIGPGRKAPSKRTRRRARRQELELAEATGGRRQPNSGALNGSKGDVRKRGQFRGESKHTKKKSFTITRQVLSKIRSECSYGEMPILDLNFVDANGRTEDRWVMIPFDSCPKLKDK